MDKEEFAKKLKEYRRLSGLTQAKMSEVMLVPLPTIKQWETSKRECPEYTQILILNELERRINQMEGEKNIDRHI